MKFKLFLISLVVLTTLATASQSMKRLREARAITQPLAMVVLSWSDLMEAQPKADERASCFIHESTAVANAGGAAATKPAASEQEEFRWQGRVGAGQSVEIKGVNGSVRAEGYSGSQVEVVATKTSSRSKTSDVEIRVLEHAGGVTICAVYPSNDASRPNDCQPGSAGHMNVNNNDVSVNFVVRVPQGVGFKGRTVNGEVEATRIGGDVEATTVNGSINVSASGIARATTVNGSIRATMGSANWNSELRFNTVNGSIILDFPNALSASVEAETLNGDISSDFPMTTESSTGGERGRPKRITGTINGGGRELLLKTVNGDISLRRGSDRAL